MRIWLPSTSASVMQTMRVIAQLVEIEVLADAAAEGRDHRLDLRVGENACPGASFPRSGSCRAGAEWPGSAGRGPSWREPPAESPSTMKISHLRRVALGAVRQLAGQGRAIPAPSLRRVRSRALRAASRARAADQALVQIGLGDARGFPRR